MQEDMHYYGTYAVAVAAGFPQEDAEILAYASQYVDDSTRDNCRPVHPDGSLLVSITTAHHILKCLAPNLQEADYQRKVWMPNHFVPGGVGQSFEEKVLCTMDSPIANDMFDNHKSLKDKPYILELLGIAAHAYMDTFSHYGFSGFGSVYNLIDNESIHISTEFKNKDEKKRIEDKLKERREADKEFIKNTLIGVASFFANEISSIGHGAVLSFPDQPYLQWKFKYIHNRPNNGKHSVRDNKADYISALSRLYDHLKEYTAIEYSEERAIPFDKKAFEAVLSIEGNKDARTDAWLKSGLLPANAKRYDARDWESEKNKFNQYVPSSEAIKMPVYRFHQAAAYHRYYMLKDLLPKHGIAVY